MIGNFWADWKLCMIEKEERFAFSLLKFDKHTRRRMALSALPIPVLVLILIWPVLTAPIPEETLNACCQRQFTSCTEAAQAYTDDAASVDEVTPAVTIKQAEEIANRVMSRHEGKWLGRTYRFVEDELAWITDIHGERRLVWWLLTGRKSREETRV